MRILSKFILATIVLITAQQVNSYSQNLNIDISRTAFSTFGSYMAISRTVGTDKSENLYLRDVSGNRLWQWNGIFKIEALKDGVPVSYTTTITPEKLTLKHGDSDAIEFTFHEMDALRVRGKGITLRLTQTIKDGNSYFIPLKDNAIRAQMGGYAHYFIKTLAGKMEVDGIQTLERGDRDKLHLVIDIKPEGGKFETVIQQYTTGIRDIDFTKPYDSCVAINRKSFAYFLKNTPTVNFKYEETRIEAAYVNWSSVVRPNGFLKRDAMFMSKVNMRSVWSWDHCFNALASASNKSFAYDQFILPFDYLDPTGAVPDIMNNHNVTWGFVKPPIHGLTLQKLQDKGLVLSKSQLNECYTGLEKWTNFWFQYMDDDKNGFPQYNHGNDSGWDNSTYFDMGYSVESADLCAFLALQMDCLANLAQRLGKPKEATAWKNRSNKLIKDMISYFWDGSKFISKRTIDKSYKAENKSLMRFLPIVLGERLPADIRKAMIDDLKSNGNITAYGLASESPSSSLYEEDGYWRGPIWAPTTYLIVDGLMKVGEKELAKSIAIKFADLCTKSKFAENFNAVTGEPLRDSGYTWTASVFLLLAGEFSK